MRKIVQIKQIDNIDPIENADAIEVAHIGGWNIVVKKDEFTVGDSILYFEIDSFLPGDVPEFEFLLPRGKKTAFSPIRQTDVTGHVLKTAKLRGTVSQGLALPLAWGLTPKSTQDDVDAVMETLGVFKWEPPVPVGGEMVGPFPHNARKTDSERVQNLSDAFLASLNKDEWVATEKIDGTSATFTKTPDGEFIIASRNWAIDKNGGNVYAEFARTHSMEETMPRGSVIQGEIFGEGINGNPLKVQGKHLRVFHVEGFDTEPDGEKWGDFEVVPTLDLVLPDTVDEAVEQVFKMKSTVNPNVNAEGVVWWNKAGKTFAETGDRPNFKAINNQFLLKNGG